MDSPVPYVSKVNEDDRVTCVLDETIFQTPPGYTQIGNGKVQAPFYFCFSYSAWCVSVLLIYIIFFSLIKSTLGALPAVLSEK